MVRSIWKGNFINKFLLIKLSLNYCLSEVNVQKKKTSRFLLKNTNVFLWNCFKNKKFFIYNGRKWTSIIIDNSMIWYNLHDFVLTRLSGVTHNLKKKKKEMRNMTAKKQRKLLKKLKKKNTLKRNPRGWKKRI